MRFNRRTAAHSNHERWLVSYADFITLLFAFFVVMFSSARMDKEKTAALASAIETAFQQMGAFPANASGGAHGAQVKAGSAKAQNAPADLSRSEWEKTAFAQPQRTKPDFASIRNELEKALAPEIRRSEVALRIEPEGLIISLREVGFYASGSATIRPEAVDAVVRVASVLHSHDCAVRIEGHTDPVPIHNSQFASNWELSTARATELVKVLVEKYDIAPDKLSAAGYAEFHPVASNATPEGQQMNRRVDFVITAADIYPHPSGTLPAMR